MISEKIVVVDDDPRVHQSLKAILSNYQLISFLDAQKGLDYLLRPNEVKLALVDVCMKELNGVELLESIRRAKKEIAVMIMTGYGSQDIVAEALRLHADDYQIGHLIGFQVFEKISFVKTIHLLFGDHLLFRKWSYGGVDFKPLLGLMPNVHHQLFFPSKYLKELFC